MVWKWVSLLLAAALLFVLAAFTSSKPRKTDFEKSKDIIVMRKIAHEVMRFTGDSSSRILPVENPVPGQYRIPFQTRVPFKPDSIVHIIDTIIKTNGLPEDYIVNISPARESHKVIFGYAISGSTQTDIIPCLGREQPAMDYTIFIRFKETEPTNPSRLYLMLAAGLALAALSAGLFRFFKNQNKEVLKENKEISAAAPDATGQIAIGRFLFYPAKQTLWLDKEEIVLTSKEARLLGIFAASINEVIDRSRLQKEVWEDDGVIVGRSLDVFISRLRKKFEKDPSVRFTTVTGKGYKLETGV